MIADLLNLLTQLGLSTVQLVAAVLVGVCVASTVLLIAYVRRRSQQVSSRAFMDSPPPLFKLFWPVILIFAWFLSKITPTPIRVATESRLRHFGASFMLNSDEFLAGFLTFPLVFVSGVLIVAQTGSEPIGVEIYWLLGTLGALLPEFWLRDLRRRRDAQIARSLPVYLEYLSMCVDAGLNFSGALIQAVEKGPLGAMRNEFRIILRDLRAGFPRDKALERMANRTQLRDVQTFVAAVVQAEKMGASIRDTLRIQAEQRLNERFQRAEKMAMEAPVKLIVPLVVFIFPLTFIMLLFPIAIRFVEEGSLF